jgi:hypothetical protein
MRPILLALMLACLVISAAAEDWTTTDGTTYHNVTVLSHDDAYVTIMHDDGGGRIALSQLNVTLQKRFAYDPAKAAACIQATAAADQRDRAAVLQEQHNQDATIAAQTTAAPFAPSAAAVPTPAPSSPAAALPPAAVAPATPPVDVVANEAKIEQDQKELGDLAVDLRIGHRDAASRFYQNGYTDGAHYDDTGTLHPNAVGTDAGDRVPQMEQRQSELQAEIKTLQDEDAKAQTASTH